ncbi:hypothetical protein [Cellulomonas timonensis]|uniref:hypothetical protein n=1 Tax=Cellulomonas timonensis TaxID=1689271 RepID=UPI0008346D8D|nr:hypothetical protein [Cellulomonas timonensis]
MRPRLLFPIILAVVAALVAGGLIVASRTGGDAGTEAGAGGQESPSATGSPLPSATVSATPSPTSSPVTPPSELPAGVPTSDQAPTAPVNPAAVEVSITFAQWSASSGAVEVAGFAAIAPEPAGTCTVRLARGADEVVVSTEAVPAATTMSCGTVSVPGGKVARGSWTATLTYESATGTGTSPQTTIEVP